MIDINKTEQERADQVRAWIKDNGLSVVLGLVIAIGGVVGFRVWQADDVATQQAASKVYQDWIAAQAIAVSAATDEAAQQKAQSLAETLLKDHAGTVYVHFLKLQQAKVAVDNKQFEQAEALLADVVSTAKDAALVETALMRQYLVLLELDRATEVLQALETIDATKTGAHTRFLIKGKAQLLLGKEAAAMANLKQAKLLTPPGFPADPLLQILVPETPIISDTKVTKLD